MDAKTRAAYLNECPVFGIDPKTKEKGYDPGQTECIKCSELDPAMVEACRTECAVGQTEETNMQEQEAVEPVQEAGDVEDTQMTQDVPTRKDDPMPTTEEDNSAKTNTETPTAIVAAAPNPCKLRPGSKRYNVYQLVAAGDKTKEEILQAMIDQGIGKTGKSALKIFTEWTNHWTEVRAYVRLVEDEVGRLGFAENG